MSRAHDQECFVTVYGDVPPEGSRKNLGVCGVCRQPMRIAEGERHRGKGGNSEWRKRSTPALTMHRTRYAHGAKWW
jgi:hypothetical protein